MSNRPGLKVWATVPAALFSLALISGCNEEAATPPANPTPPPGPAVKAPEPAKKTGEATPPPPSTPKAEEKKK